MAGDNTNNTCLQCEIWGRATVETDFTKLAKLKFYSKSVHLMMMRSRFDAIGTKVGELLLASSTMNPSLRNDLKDSQEEGMSRVELSLFGEESIQNTSTERVSAFLDYLIEKVFNSEVWAEHAFCLIPTGSLVSKFLSATTTHIILDQHYVWVVLAQGNNRHMHTGWTRRYTSFEQFEDFVKRFAPFGNELRFYHYLNPDQHFKMKKTTPLLEIFGTELCPDIYRPIARASVPGLQLTPLTKEQIATIELIKI